MINTEYHISYGAFAPDKTERSAWVGNAASVEDAVKQTRAELHARGFKRVNIYGTGTQADHERIMNFLYRVGAFG